ncbi:aminotransferase class I/II-fold pyridoxal phosphate-dependent enzyme [Brevundimonas sp.]|uniref:pyridoxal phosphate-dependent aminotransferase n=1 Tax=Brevundimonas sp. TaxID=1871086 RepID=UPI002637469C|nr:aminotransferase class I/II-fold pyridoxal phosphate-dependent enzyme [Brevundimonas sp.]
MSRRFLLGGGTGLAGAALLGSAAPATARQTSSAPIRLSLNENPWGPSPTVEPAIRSALGRVNRYVEGEQNDLIAVIAALEGVNPDQIILGEVLAPLGLQLALKGGAASRFVYSAPGYAGFTDAAAAVGGRIVGVPLNDRLENDLPALLAALEDRTEALFLVNPHNPSGTVSDPAALRAYLLEASAKTLVIVDEAYLEYTDDFAGRTAVGLVRDGANLVVFRTLAKVYGLAGLQAGYAVAPAALASELKAKGVGAPHSLDQLTLAASTAALTDQAHVHRVAAETARERDLWHAELDARGWPRTQSRANFVFFRSGRPHAELAAALAAEGIIVGRANPPLTDWTRVTLGLPEENRRAREAVLRLGRAV